MFVKIVLHKPSKESQEQLQWITKILWSQWGLAFNLQLMLTPSSTPTKAKENPSGERGFPALAAFWNHRGIKNKISVSRPYSKPIKSESLGVGPRHHYILKPSRDSNMQPSSRSTSIERLALAHNQGSGPPYTRCQACRAGKVARHAWSCHSPMPA